MYCSTRNQKRGTWGKEAPTYTRNNTGTAIRALTLRFSGDQMPFGLHIDLFILQVFKMGN